MMSAEQRNTARLLEENIELKQYIDVFNKECLELQAALFEEANKMAQTAYASKNKSELIAAELRKENAVLLAEVADLKQILRKNLQQSQESLTMRKSMSINGDLEIKDKGSKIERHRSTATMPSDFNLFRPRHLSLSRPKLSTSIINVTTQEPATRKGLFEALTTFPSNTFVDNVGQKSFQDFMAWVDGGCILELPHIEKRLSTEIVHQRERLNSSSSDAGDVELQPRPYLIGSSSLSRSSPYAFLLSLDIEEVSPSLNFADEVICQALRNALPLLAIEMEPRGQNGPAQACSLVLGQKSSWNLHLEVPGSNGTKQSLTIPICSSARQQIAALADLFQYLTLIRRGLTGTPTTSNDHSDDDTTASSKPISSAETQHSIRRHQFENVQRRRAAVSLARLGYGLPLME